jgi:thiazole synthase ThiGH ThiG subunit
MGQFRRDAKAPVSQSSAVAVAIQAGKQNRAYREEQKRKAAEAPRFSSKFLATGK